MRRRTLALLAAAAALVAVVAIGLSQSTGGNGGSDAEPPTPAEARALLAGAPAPLARLHARSSQLLPAASARAELAALRGHPVVVNKWGSWCGPCRTEFPTFQRVSAELGRRVAFLGLDVEDPRGDAAGFLRAHPVSYPSFYDPDLKASQAYGVAATFNPTTFFYDAAGRQTYVHQGPYTTVADLRADIAEYTRG